MTSVATDDNRATVLTEAWSTLLTPTTVNTAQIIQSVVREQQLLNLQVWELTEKLRDATNSTTSQQKEVEQYTARLKATKVRSEALNKQLLIIKNRLIKVHERMRARTAALKKDNDFLREELTEEQRGARQAPSPAHVGDSNTRGSSTAILSNHSVKTASERDVAETASHPDAIMDHTEVGIIAEEAATEEVASLPPPKEDTAAPTKVIDEAETLQANDDVTSELGQVAPALAAEPEQVSEPEPVAEPEPLADKAIEATEPVSSHVDPEVTSEQTTEEIPADQQPQTPATPAAEEPEGVTEDKQQTPEAQQPAEDDRAEEDPVAEEAAPKPKPKGKQGKKGGKK